VETFGRKASMRACLSAGFVFAANAVSSGAVSAAKRLSCWAAVAIALSDV